MKIPPSSYFVFMEIRSRAWSQVSSLNLGTLPPPPPLWRVSLWPVTAVTWGSWGSGPPPPRPLLLSDMTLGLFVKKERGICEILCSAFTFQVFSDVTLRCRCHCARLFRASGAPVQIPSCHWPSVPAVPLPSSWASLKAHLRWALECAWGSCKNIATMRTWQALGWH